MSKLSVIENTLNARIASGEITYEDAQKVFDVACMKYADEEGPEIETQESTEDNNDEITLEEAISVIKNYLEKCDKCDVGEKDLEPAPKKGTSEDVPKTLKNNDTSSKRVIGDAADEIENKKVEMESYNDLVREVNGLKLAVLESAASGAIDDETRDVFLWHLDLNNWDI